MAKETARNNKFVWIMFCEKINDAVNPSILKSRYYVGLRSDGVVLNKRVNKIAPIVQGDNPVTKDLGWNRSGHLKEVMQSVGLPSDKEGDHYKDYLASKGYILDESPIKRGRKVI